MKNLTALISGLLFAFGLGLSGMMNPLKVRGFLDLTGVWDPALAFVMVGAISVYAIAFRFITQKPRPACEASFALPTKKEIEPKLILGSGLFGIGWGIAGVCPGPAIANLATGLPQALVFVAVMVATIGLVRLVENKK